jgi:hypothetical protein
MQATNLQIVAGICRGRNLNSSHLQKLLGSDVIISNHYSNIYRSVKSNKPQLYPFQFLDCDGVVTTRFAYVNYVPTIISPQLLDSISPVVNKYIRETYLPYWNTKSVITNYTVLPGDVGLPVFDGTFIPIFFLNANQFVPGSASSKGGATNVNNVPNFLAGPEISFYLQATPDFSLPNLPISNPYVMVPVGNFLRNQVTITTNTPGYGPYIGIPSVSATPPTSFPQPPFSAPGATSSPNTSGCLGGYGNMSGKIAVFSPHDSTPPNSCGASFVVNSAAAAGAEAVLMYTTRQFPFQFTAGGANVWSAAVDASVTPSLLDGIQNVPNFQIFISAPSPVVIPNNNLLTNIISHEVEEMLIDPAYADYILSVATSFPLVDKPTGQQPAVLFSQYENSDQDEGSPLVIETANNVSYGMAAFPTPSYYIANLRNNNYDNIGLTWRPLIPPGRQQVVFQQKGNPLQVSVGVQGFLQTSSPLRLAAGQSVFPPQTTFSTTPITSSPLAPIYNTLQTLNNVFLI